MAQGPPGEEAPQANFAASAAASKAPPGEGQEGTPLGSHPAAPWLSNSVEYHALEKEEGSVEGFEAPQKVLCGNVLANGLVFAAIFIFTTSISSVVTKVGSGSVKATTQSPGICRPQNTPLDFSLSLKATAAPSFTHSSEWAGKCQSLESPPSLTATPRWPGQDNCWGWVKKIGCYETNSANDWLKAQELAALQSRAPDPEKEYTMEPVRSPEMCMKVSPGAELTDVTTEDTNAATAWLNEHVSIYVLNIAADTERLTTMGAAMDELGIKWSRIPGVDMRVDGALKAAQKLGFVPPGFDFAQAQAAADTDYQGMGGILGTVGCAAAHLNAMKVAVGNYRLSPQKEIALIFEDDVRPNADFAVKLQRLLRDEAPCDWAAISLRSRCPYGECVSEHLTRVLPDGNEPEDRCRHGVNYGFFAMLYRLEVLPALRARLADRVWDASAPRCLDVDVALASISDKVAYYAVPFMQEPGFVREESHGSARFETNQASKENG